MRRNRDWRRIKWEDYTRGSRMEDLDELKYPNGYWMLTYRDEHDIPFTYYLDSVAGGSWKLELHTGEQPMYFNELEEAKATVIALVRMGAINPE